MKNFFKRFTSSAQSPPVIVVSGLPRSGTSMMMKMLQKAGIPLLTDGLRTADEDNPKGYYEYEPVKSLAKSNFSWLPDAQGKAVKIISSLLMKLPETYCYKTIFMKRDIQEVLASQKRMLIRRNEPTDKITDQELTILFEKHLTKTYAWMEHHPKMTFTTVAYSSLMKDPEPQLEKICRLLDQKLDLSSMIDVIDPSLYRQRIKQGA